MKKQDKKYWKTQDGNEIEYSKIEDSHLLNILTWISRRAKNGMVMRVGGGCDHHDFWYEEWPIEGNEVLEHYDYQGLEKEAKKRNLL